MNGSADSPVGLRQAAPRSERGEDVAVILDAVRSLARALRLASNEMGRRVGVHATQLHALRQLADGRTSLTGLAERTRTDASSASVVVSRLVELGLVDRWAAEGDRRRLSLGLTARGRAVVRRASDPDTARFIRAIAKLSDRDVHTIAGGLSKLAVGFRDIAD